MTLLRLALGNLFSSFLNIIIGLFIAAGAMLLVVFSAMLGSVDHSLTRSVTGSVSGDLQVYSAKSKDALALFGNMGEDGDLTAFEKYGVLEKALLSVPEVRSVVPMGLANALITSGNQVDLALERLRSTVKEAKEKGATPERTARLGAQKRHIHQIARVLLGDLQKFREIATEGAFDPEAMADVQRAASDAFWEGFDADPFAALEFLENRLAPQASEGDLLYIRYAGTDLDTYEKVFDRFRIVDGTRVPTGRRGLLLAKRNYEDMFKLKNARRLDRIDEAIREKDKTIAMDEELQRMVRENRTQLREIVLQLDELETAEMTKRLQGELGSKETKLPELLGAFFDMNDSNFARRYRFFYDALAPMVELYGLRIGDSLTIKAFTRNGFSSSVNVPLYGTFEYSGLEKSPLAGAINLMDLMSFRDLYGYETAESRAEMQSLKATARAKMIDRESAEAELFGAGPGEGEDSPAGAAVAAPAPELPKAPGAPATERDVRESFFTAADIRQGMVLNAAVMLKEPERATDAMKAIQEAGKREGLELKVISWIEAAGMFGGFIMVLNAALYIFVFIIVLVSMVIINNALMMATLRRVKEIGTLRAIGAQSGFVLRLVLVETLLLGLVFGGSGALAGVGLMKLLQKVGIPATNDWLQFFFSGNRLHPAVGLGDFLFGLLLVLAVSGFSILYPAYLATRVSPLQAMQTDE